MHRLSRQVEPSAQNPPLGTDTEDPTSYSFPPLTFTRGWNSRAGTGEKSYSPAVAFARELECELKAACQAASSISRE